MLQRLGVVSNIFREYRNETLTWNGLKRLTMRLSKNSKGSKNLQGCGPCLNESYRGT